MKNLPKTQLARHAKYGDGLELLNDTGRSLACSGRDLHKGIIILVSLIFCDHVGILIWIFCIRGIWLTLVNLIVIILVERVWRAKSIESISSACSGRYLHKRIIIILVGLIFCDHVGILIRIFCIRGIWLALVHLVIIVLVERIWSSKSIESIASPCLGRDLHKGVIVLVGLIFCDHVGILIRV